MTPTPLSHFCKSPVWRCWSRVWSVQRSKLSLWTVLSVHSIFFRLLSVNLVQKHAMWDSKCFSVAALNLIFNPTCHHVKPYVLFIVLNSGLCVPLSKLSPFFLFKRDFFYAGRLSNLASGYRSSIHRCLIIAAKCYFHGGHFDSGSTGVADNINC